MKRIKKIVSMMLAVIMVLGMSLTVFAADNNPYKITVKQNENDAAEHTYSAYQIFAGDLAPNADHRNILQCTKTEHTHTDGCIDEEGNVVCGEEEHTHTRECYSRYNAPYILSNIVWGSGIDQTKTNDLLNELKADGDGMFSGAFKSCATAADVAKALTEFNNTSVGESGALDYFADIIYKYLTTEETNIKTGAGKGDVEIDVTGAGYYLVTDTTDKLSGESAYTRSLLEVVGDSIMVVKSEVPSGDKEIYTAEDAWADANNATVGTNVSYRITSKVPNYAGYDYYYFIMNDTLDQGLNFNEESVTVKVGNITLTKDIDYRVYTTEIGSYSFRLAFDNIMNYRTGNEIVVSYSARVENIENANLKIGTEGNANTWSLEFSNNPNDTYDGTQDTSKPGLPSTESTVSLGETPEEKTLTYLTELDITKYMNEVLDDNELAGAEFTLTGTSKQVVVTKTEYFREASANERGTYYLLLDGTYTEAAPTEVSYEEIGEGNAETTEGYLKADDGSYFVPDDVKEYNGKIVYKQVEGTVTNYADVNVMYVKDTADNTEVVFAPVSIKLTTGEDGKISFVGLGEGTYTLTETVTPAGYNTIDPITFTISCDLPSAVTEGNETCVWRIEGLGITNGETPTGNLSGMVGIDGIFKADIINVSGALLPSTGGIGTTIFYVVGGLMVFAAVVLLVTKKRMSAEKK